MSLFSEWTKLSTNNKNLFTNRWGHTTTYFEDKIYFFGGFNGTFLNDFFALNLSNLTFEALPTTGTPPAPRSNHTAVLCKKVIIIHGGSHPDNNTQYSDTYFFNLDCNHWTKLAEGESDKPQARTYHTANSIDNYMVVFGGENENEYEDSLVEMRVLDLETNKWININTQLVSSRSFHCSAVADKKLFVYGGYQYDRSEDYRCLNELVIFDFSNFIKENPNSVKIQIIKFKEYSTSYPYPRWGSSLTANSESTGSLILFGGRNAMDFNDTWVFDIKSAKWSKIIHSKYSNLEMPPKRRRHSSAFITGSQILIITGGFNGDYLNDVYLMNLNSCIKFHTSSECYSKFINNSLYSDFIITNKNPSFYAHKNLFFRRINQDDIISSKILQIAFKSKRVEINIPVNTNCVLTLIEILYTGKLKNYKTFEEYKELYRLLKFLRLQNAILKISKVIVRSLKFMLFDYSNINAILQNSHVIKNFNIFECTSLTDQIPSDILIYHDVTEKFLNIENSSFNSFPFVNNVLDEFLYAKEKFYEKILLIVKREKLPHNLFDNLEELVELFFQADFLSIDFLFNKLELVLTEYINQSNIHILLPIAFKCNSQILLHRIIDFIGIGIGNGNGASNTNTNVYQELEDKLNAFLIEEDKCTIMSEVKNILKINRKFHNLLQINNENRMKIFTSEFEINLDRLSDKLIQTIFKKIYAKNYIQNNCEKVKIKITDLVTPYNNNKKCNKLK